MSPKLGKENSPLVSVSKMNTSKNSSGKRNSGGGRRSLKFSVLNNRTCFAPWRSSSPLALYPMKKTLHDTITLESSTDTEIIDASVHDVSTNYDWIRTPRTAKAAAATPTKAVSPRARSPRAATLAIETNKPKSSEVLAKPNKDNSPIGLGRSKRRHVEQWLATASVETRTTPPFTPSPPRRRNDDSSSSIDPEVKDVLIAVYGTDWKKTCKTDVKKKPVNSIKKIQTESKARRKSLTVEPRRNILTALLTRSTKRKSPSVSKRKIDKVISKEDVNEQENSVSKRRRVRRNIFLDGDDAVKPLETEAANQNATESPVLMPIPPLDSTKKRSRPRRKRLISEESEDVPASPGLRSTTKGTPRRTFLASLSVSTPTSVSHPEAQIYKVKFASKKEELCAKLFKLYNNEVFENGLPDDMKLTWNPKMRWTAGYCYNKRVTRGTQITRSARVELATRVVDRADRLRDTLAHELCHAAAWIIDGVLDGHGSVWSRWAARVTERFPELPPVRRCHNYEVAAKYTYRCTSCGYSINRHSRSIDLDRKRCGLCYGVLELLVNKKKKGNTEVPEFDTTRTIKPPTAFALFVKEHYKRVKVSCPDKKHGEIMKLLGQQYAIFKSVVTPGKK